MNEKWAVARCKFSNVEEVKKYLGNDWEPFAVTIIESEPVVWFRKKK